MSDIEAAMTTIKSGTILPTYLLVGEEMFLSDQLIAQVRQALFHTSESSFDEEHFTAGETSIDRVLNSARMVPMLNSHRLVLVHHIDRWEASSSNADSPKASSPLDTLAAYLEAPIVTTCLIMTAGALDGRRKLSGIAKKKGYFFSCNALNPRTLPIWICQQFKKRGNPLSAGVAELISELVGPDLRCVNDAIERLSLYAQEQATITEQDVRTCITRTRTTEVWAIVNAIRSFHLTQALSILKDVYDPRDRGLPLLGLLSWSVRQLLRLQAIAHSNQHSSLETIGRKVGIFPPSRTRELLEQSQSLYPKVLIEWLSLLAETDIALKSSKRPPYIILEETLIRMSQCTLH
ncbi:DNA polymerase III subunit delta [Pajaroellobacter abortibovis]|uniref:DNA polymerase III subunit delta n=1 Tax=Pajaroellobacter abortibovis TaxID=1882918 RepID=A0A1L6MWA0_9BACT|nr:DNA polymerase III subunit delta [Pajaroellobacter abortibovis]APR99695.1 DNA polymerase III subunit delta [Pajaroellobacter abortibovis]